LEQAGIEQRMHIAVHGLHVPVYPSCRLSDRYRSGAEKGADLFPPLHRQ
jgi:hypothetical protein